MPAKDKYHEAVRNALTKDGWTITHDPLRLTWGIKDMYIDLGAELKRLAANPQYTTWSKPVASFCSIGLYYRKESRKEFFTLLFHWKH